MTTLDSNPQLSQLIELLDNACQRLRDTRGFAKATRIHAVLDICRRIMSLEDGTRSIYERMQRLEEAGIFSGSDWQYPNRLQSILTANTIRQGNPPLVTLECLNQLRFAAVANGDYLHPSLSSERAAHFLSQSLALNLSLVFGKISEAERKQLGKSANAVLNNFAFVAEQIGIANIINELINEIWRLLSQRPIETNNIKEMITQLAVYLNETDTGLAAGQNRGADRLISALYSPTRGCQEDPGIDEYRNRLMSMDDQALRNEALGFSRAMHDTGIVSVYHVIFLRFIREEHNDLIGSCLGLSSTGYDSLLSYQTLVNRLIDEAVWPETAQVILGLSGLLERGILYDTPVSLALWRHINLPINPAATKRMERIENISDKAMLLAGIINILGQPLGIGQGNNPLCQSVRAISMWADNDPNYLLQLIAWAAKDNDIVMYFEGQRLSSAKLLLNSRINGNLFDLDTVSSIIVPHLDVIYQHMGQLCSGRGEDIHKWVNPEFHGWWVGRDFSIAVDINTGLLVDYDIFIRRFFSCYHPFYNGNNPVVNPQPVGIASTDGMARFLGWHAVSLLRIGFDPEKVMRVYFFNPHNDSGQNWGNGIKVSTEGHGERFGESSLPFAEFASRLYIFHYDEREQGDSTLISMEEVEEIKKMAIASWAKDRVSLPA